MIEFRVTVSQCPKSGKPVVAITGEDDPQVSGQLRAFAVRLRRAINFMVGTMLPEHLEIVGDPGSATVEENIRRIRGEELGR